MTRRLHLRQDGTTQHAARNEPLMDIDGVADSLNTTVRHVRRLAAERRLPHYKIGAKLRFDRLELDAWVAQTRVPARDQDTWHVETEESRAPHANTRRRATGPDR